MRRRRKRDASARSCSSRSSGFSPMSGTERGHQTGRRATHVPLDAAEAESRYQTEPADSMTPERIFERRWAVTVLEQTLVRLRAEYERLQRLPEFERLKEFLTAERGTIPYGEVADALGVSAGAARAAVHRLRKRFRELFREQIAQTVSNSDDLEDELRYVVAALWRRLEFRAAP